MFGELAVLLAVGYGLLWCAFADLDVDLVAEAVFDGVESGCFLELDVALEVIFACVGAYFSSVY